MSTNAPAVAPRTRASLSWRMYAFQVSRRSSRGPVATAVRPRRVCVFAPWPEAAAPGAGAGRDEMVRAVAVRPWETLVRTATPAREEIADFFETVGNALATGSGMTLALNMAARTARSPLMRGIIGALHDRVIHGEDLHVAMRAFPRAFSPMQLAMVEAAAATGLDKAGGLLITLSERLQRDGKIWRKFVGALAYPVSLVALTILGAIVLEIWALPPMVELFRTLGGRLPPLTQHFYAVAQFIHRNGLWLAPVTAAVVMSATCLAPRLMQLRATQRIATRLWLVGPILQSLALVRALGTFILLKQSGARVRDQFGMAASAAGNCVVGDFFEACYARIAVGDSVEEAFTAERHRLGDDGLRLAGKMEVGMAGADLGTLIQRIIAELNDRAETRLNLLPTMIRWPLLILCCGLIGTVALAIVLPYPNLIADVAHQQAEASVVK